MRAADEAGRELRSTESTTAHLEDLIPIAVVVAAGCERCAEKMVERALRQGSSRLLVERTLGIVSYLRSTDCFAEAVGPEVVSRMEKPLEAGRRTLRESASPLPAGTCCG